MSTLLNNKDATIYLAQERLAEWAGYIVSSSVRKSKYYQNKAERLRYYLKAMQYEYFLEEQEIIYLLQCMQKIAEVTDWPTAPVLTEKVQPNILLGIPGKDGQDGATGTPGSDADIAVVNDTQYDNMSIIEFDDNGVKTYKIGYAPLTPPTISMVLTTGGLPNANSYYQEAGQIMDVPMVSTLNKGRDNVTASAVTSPTALNTNYQNTLDLTLINNGSQQQITVTDGGVTTTTTYSVNITDGNTTPSATRTLTFVIPFLWGSSTFQLAQGTAYSNLARIIRPKENQAVKFNGTDSYFYMMYDASYPDLTSITDGNGFEAISAFTKTTELIDMLSGPESMKVYVTDLTDIPNQTYTFKF